MTLAHSRSCSPESRRGVVLVEGLPGAGKSTHAHALGVTLAESGVAALHWPEGRSDHPVDFENVSLVPHGILAHLREKDPSAWYELRAQAERYPDGWIIRRTDQLTVPEGIAEQVRRLDAYDGDVTADSHRRALVESWRRFGAREPRPEVQIWECVLIQNPLTALVARFDQPPHALAEHAQQLVSAIRSHNPMLVYLDPGDPEPVLRRAAHERPPEWLDSAVRYRTDQGYSRRRGLTGFDGYVAFLRMRRELELDLVRSLDLPSLVVATGDEPAARTRERVLQFVNQHLIGG